MEEFSARVNMHENPHPDSRNFCIVKTRKRLQCSFYCGIF